MGVTLNVPPVFLAGYNKQTKTEQHSAGRSRRGVDGPPEAQPELHEARYGGAVHGYLVDDGFFTAGSNFSRRRRDTPVLGLRQVLACCDPGTPVELPGIRCAHQVDELCGLFCPCLKEKHETKQSTSEKNVTTVSTLCCLIRIWRGFC